MLLAILRRPFRNSRATPRGIKDAVAHIAAHARLLMDPRAPSEEPLWGSSRFLFSGLITAPQAVAKRQMLFTGDTSFRAWLPYYIMQSLIARATPTSSLSN